MMTETQDVSQDTGQHDWTHVLTELTSLEELSIPLRGSARLRYTCVAVSRRYIALGANTGAVYIFGRESLKHLQVVLAEKDSSPVTQVCFGPIDNLLGYACSNGNIMVVELNIERRSKPERVRLSMEHSGTTVTALQWDTVAGRLFAGDNLGKISVAFIPASKAKDLFQHPSEGIVRLDSAIVQLDWSSDRLLVSTVTRCYICYTSRQQYSQIGKRLRDGQFGACFYPGPDGQTPSIYCARPGSRIWEVDYHGTVLNTHQFKQLLAIPPFPIISIRSMELKLPDKLESGKAQSVSFPKLHTVCDVYLFTWSHSGLYVLDPVAVKVITWTNYSAGETVFQEYWSLAGQLCVYFDQLLMDAKSRRHLPRSALNDFHQQLLETDMGELADKVKVILTSIDSLPDSSGEEGGMGIVRLDSGIYQVNDGRRFDSDEESSHTPSGSQSLSRKSSTSSLQAMFSDYFINMPSKRPREFNATEPPAQTGSTPTERSEKITRSVSLTEPILMRTEEDQISVSKVENGDEKVIEDSTNNSKQSVDLVKPETDGSVYETGSVNSVDHLETKVNNDVDLRSPRHLTDGQETFDKVDPQILAENKEASDQVDPRSPDLIDEKETLDKVDPRSQFLRDKIEASDQVDHRSSGVSTDNKRGFDQMDPRSPGALADKETFDHGNVRSPEVLTSNKGTSDEVDSRSGILTDPRSGIHTDPSHEKKLAEVVPMRKGSTSSLSSIFSNEPIMDQVFTAEPVVIKTESAKKSGRKKKASHPVILAPGEKQESKGPWRSLSNTGAARKQNFRRRAISDLGPTAFIQEAIMEVEKQEPASADQTESQDKMVCEQSIAALPMMQYSSWTVRSSSPINTQESSPSHNPVVREGSSSPTNITGPRTALKSVKESLSSKFSSTKKNLMRTIREKKTMFASRDSSPVGNMARENLQNEQQRLPSGSAFGGRKTERSETPPVEDRNDDVPEELSPLYHATRKALAELKHADTLLQPHPVLSVWLKQLHETLQQLRRTQQKHRDAQTKASLLSGVHRTEDAAKDEDGNGVSQDAEEAVTDMSQGLAAVGEPNRSVKKDGQQHKDRFETEETRIGGKQVCLDRDTFSEVNGKLDHDTPMSSLRESGEMMDCNHHAMHKDVMISDSLASLPVKDLDSVSVDSGHPAVDGQSEDTGSDLEARMSADQDDVALTVLDALSDSQTDQGIPASSCSSATSDSFAESPQLFHDQFRTSHAGDGKITLSKSNLDTAEEALADVDWMKRCYISDPLNAGQHFSEDIGYLANICFELGLHERISDYIQSQNTAKISAEITVIQDIRTTTDECPETDRSSGQIREEEEDDRQLALFLRNYYSYLDIARVRKALKSSGCHGYQTWQALVDCFVEVARGDSVSARLGDNDTMGAFDLLRSRVGCDPAAVVGHLPRLFTVSPNKSLEFCLEEIKYIQPLDILYVTRLLSKSVQQLFLPYMLARHSAMTQPGDLCALCESVKVRQTWLRGLLAEEDTASLMTHDNLPRPGSHLYPWKHQTIIKSLLDEFMAEDAAQLQDICQEFGYWLGSLQMLHRLHLKQKGLEIVARLRDITLLAADEWYPVSLEEWQCILDAMVNLTARSEERLESKQTEVTSRAVKTGWTPNWTPSLTWDSLGLLLAQSVGADKAISLLQGLPLPPDALTLSFYQGLIVTTIGTRQKRSLLHNILEKTDAYLWAKKPAQMAAQLHYAAEEERKMVSAGREGKQTQVFKDMFTQLESQADLVCHRFVEDPECHWGVRCDFNRACPCCGLQLSAQVSISQPGVLVFHCGHGYHKFCHPDKVCQVCSESVNRLSY